MLSWKKRANSSAESWSIPVMFGLVDGVAVL